MKKENTALLIFRTFLAVVFSILLVVLLLVVPLYNTVTAITQPKRIAAMLGDVVKSIDLTEMIELPENIQIGDKTLDADATKAILQSDVAKKILGACTEQMMLAYTSEDPTVVFTEDTVQTILADNTDDLTDLLQQHVPQAAELPVEEIQQQLSSNLTALSQQVMEQLPSKEELQQLTGGDIKDKVTDKVEDTLGDKVDSNAVGDALDQAQDAVEDVQGTVTDSLNAATDTLATVQQILSPAVAYTLYGAVAILALLILLCRYKNLNGLVWLGVDGLLAGIPLMGLCLALGSGGTLPMFLSLSSGPLFMSLLSETGLPATVISSIVKVVLGEVQAGAIILLVAGVVLIAGGIVYKVMRKKAAKKAENAVPLSSMM